MAKNIIFDWSGVIKDAAESHLWVINKIFEKFGINKISLEEFKENWEQPYMLFYNKYLPNLTLEEEQAAYKEIILSGGCPKSASYPGIAGLIKKIKEKDNFMAVISSDLPDTIFSEIKEYGLEDIFDDIITDVHDKVEAASRLIKKGNLDLGNTFFVGDSNHEIEAGKRVGIKTIAVTWGFCPEKKLQLEKPDFIARSIKDLERIIL